MTAERLFRLAGIAAVIGGLLRLVGTFAPLLVPAAWQQPFYFVIDLFLLPGLTGIYLSQSARIGIVGLLAYLVCFAGILVIRTWGGGAYIAGAGMFSIGMALIGAMLLIRTSFPKWIAWLWIASFAFGLLRLALPTSDWPVMLAGVLFALGFAAAGMALASEG